MAERAISEQMITDALEKPTKIGRDPKGRILVKKLYKRNGKARLLLLAIEKETDPLCIITVIDTTKITKYL